MKDLFNKTINKVFFNKTIFKTTAVLLFFIGLVCFIWLSSNYKYPYFGSSDKYSNFIEFVEVNFENEVVYEDQRYFDFNKFSNQQAFIVQSIKKKIITPINLLTTNKEILIAATYACDDDKFKEFKNKYYRANKIDFYDFGINNHKISMERVSKFLLGRKMKDISIDCEKAKTVSLEADGYYYYYFHNEFIPLMLGSFIIIPFGMLLFLILIRFIIISPIIWIFRKN